MSNSNLSQEEIDALLNKRNAGAETGVEKDTSITDHNGTEIPADSSSIKEDSAGESPGGENGSESLPQEDELLSPEEKDALGEIGNISMGSSSTTLSELLQKRVTITSPRVHVMTRDELLSSFVVPYMIIQVEFKEGLSGFNVLVIQLQDARVLAGLMMGGGEMDVQEQMSEMEVSAASEAMNQMIGTASTSLADMFGRNINISPPTTVVLETHEKSGYQLPIEDPIVVVSFRMTVEQLMDTEIMQIMSLETAKDLASMLWEGITPAESPDEPGPGELNAGDPASADAVNEHRLSASPHHIASSSGNEKRQPELDINQDRLAMLMDIPLHATVVLGRARKAIKEVLNYTPGAVVELASPVEEPVEVLVNGVPVARGEIVVVNENFGVKITDILTPAERVARLTDSD